MRRSFLVHESRDCDLEWTDSGTESKCLIPEETTVKLERLRMSKECK